MPSKAAWPAIFYAPHQDDEALAMAGAIAEHKDAGRPVYLVLLTDGNPSPHLLDILNGAKYCPLHETTHDFELGPEEVVRARNAEFRASGERLGVDGVFFGAPHLRLWSDLPKRRHIDLVEHVGKTIAWFESQYPGASHKLVSGQLDTYTHAGTGEERTRKSHRACWEAALILRDRIADFRFYRVYVFDKPVSQRTAQHKRKLTPVWVERKRAACDEYGVLDPAHGRYAAGHHSTHTTFVAALEDHTEYIDLLP
jgi:LmbE family N-acetylglucosaminyl deacetylase